jgi:hypothetical protein
MGPWWPFTYSVGVLKATPAALRHRDFALLWSGQSVSLIGDGVYTVALALETLRIDNHPLALSLVLAARLLPTVLLLVVGGVIVDRIPRRSPCSPQTRPAASLSR